LSIVREFPFGAVELDLVPFKAKNGVRVPFRVGMVDKELEQLESFINGKRTVAEIMDLMNLTDRDVLALVSILARYRWIDFKRRLTDEDILVRSNCDGVKLERLKSQYGTTEVESLLTKFDGTSRIADVSGSLDFDKDALWFLLNKLVEEGCLMRKVGSENPV
jgi:hypothetical protein